MDYQELNLDDIGFLGRGKSKHRPRNDPALFGGEYPFIQTGDVKAANLHVREYSETYNETGLAQSKLWDKGTLLITIAANIAETAVLDIKACFPDSVVGFVPDESKVNAYFIKYYIDFIKREMQNISHGTTQDNLSLDKLRLFKFKIPPKIKVDEITDILLSYDRLIENNNRRIAILEEMAQSLYREWFVKFRFPGHEDTKFIDSPLGKIPEGWEIKEIKDFGEVVTGKTPSKKEPANFGDDVAFVKTPDMHGGMFVTDTSEGLSLKGADSQKKKYLPANSILVSCIGTAGVVAINSEVVQTNQQINAVKLCEYKYREYLYFALVDLEETIKNYGSTGATMTNLSKGKFEGLNVLIPKNYIDEFHAITSPIFDEILCLSKKNNLLKSQRDLLLPKLISGNIELV